MSPNMKRYLPWLGLVGAIVVGVYVMGGDRLLGEAGFGGDNIAHLGKVDSQLFTKLDDLLQHSVVPHVRGKEREDAALIQVDIEKVGPGALASVVSHFRDNGCVQPGSAAEVELIDRLVLADGVTSLQRRVVAFILVDAAAHGVRDLELGVEGQPFAGVAEVTPIVNKLKDGTLKAELPQVPTMKPDLDSITLDCSMRALATTATILQKGVVDAAAIQRQSASVLQSLPKDHPAAEAFVHVATLSASAAKMAPTSVLEIVTNANLGDVARGAACRAALDMQVPLPDLKTAIGEQPAPALQSCLVDAGDGSVIAAALKSDNRSLRIHAIRRQKMAPDPEVVKQALTTAYQDDLSPRERQAWVESIARTVVASDKPETLLASIDALDVAHPHSPIVQELAEAILRFNPKRPRLEVPEGTIVATAAELAAARAANDPTQGAGDALAQAPDGDPTQAPANQLAKAPSDDPTQGSGDNVAKAGDPTQGSGDNVAKAPAGDPTQAGAGSLANGGDPTQAPADSLAKGGDPTQAPAGGLAQQGDPTQASGDNLPDQEHENLAAMLALMAKQETSILVPNGIVAERAPQQGDKGEMVLRISLPRRGVGVCDVVVDPGVAQEVVDGALKDPSITVVCLTPGSYSGPLVLKKPGVQLVALDAGTVLEGAVIVEAPTVLVGFQISGPIAIAETAHGSTLAGNAFALGGLSLTDQVAMVGNTVGDGKQITVPGGYLPPEMVVPGVFLAGNRKDRQAVVALEAHWPPRVY